MRRAGFSVILSLRLYALWGLDKRILAIMVVSFISTLSVSAALVANGVAKISGMSVRHTILVLLYPIHLSSNLDSDPRFAVLHSFGTAGVLLSLLVSNFMLGNGAIHLSDCTRPPIILLGTRKHQKANFSSCPNSRLSAVFPSVSIMYS